MGQVFGGSSERRAVQGRLSMASIFGAASERRLSEERRPSIRNSLLLDGTDRNASSDGAAQPDLREKSENASGEIKVNSATVGALSSRDFGLHQWKEYAVLRRAKESSSVEHRSQSPHLSRRPACASCCLRPEHGIRKTVQLQPEQRLERVLSNFPRRSNLKRAIRDPRHGSNRRFVKSQHGREILAETAAAIRAKEVRGRRLWVCQTHAHSPAPSEFPRVTTRSKRRM